MSDPTFSGFNEPHPHSRQQRLVVLLVDDQPIIGEAVRRALASEADIDFHYCAQANEAVATAEALRPNVIMQDLVMPGVDGMTLVHHYRIHPVLKHVPVIVLSSKEDAVVKSQAFATGATDYLVKLPDSIELIARVRHHARAYLNQIERDEAYRVLSEHQKRLLELNETLRRLSDVDGLTGLNNRRYLDSYLDAEWRRALREGTEFSVLMLDVDNFKLYNDYYGHLAGDEVLKEVAGVMRQTLQRPADLAARYGGEEFTVVLPSTPASGALLIAEQLCSAVRALALPNPAAPSGIVTVSVGVATAAPAHRESYAPLLRVADMALYEAKRAGKDQAVYRVREE
ncbi:diguanylate cyclase [Lysobacter enzymogenes]|uniref:diguanylate cyclase n=1 Tax=Lysobacter enzymogenes TaxID=69 RepID=UPI00384FE281